MHPSDPALSEESFKKIVAILHELSTPGPLIFVATPDVCSATRARALNFIQAGQKGRSGSHKQREAGREENKFDDDLIYAIPRSC